MFERAKEKIKKTLRELLYSEKFEKWLRTGESITGVTVDEDTVFNLAVVWACINSIAQTIGCLPLILYRRIGKGKERLPEHYLYDLLRNNPNPNILPSTFKETIMVHVLTWGNAFAEIEQDRVARPRALWPMHPSRVKPYQKPDKTMWYEIRVDNSIYHLPSERIFHLPGLSFDGISGTTPVAKCREAFGMALASQEYGGRFFRNDANPGGVLEHPGQLSDKAYDRLQKFIERHHEGLEKKHRFMLLEEGMKWEKIGLSPADSQFLEGRKFSVADIARMFRVPPHVIGDLEKASFNNIEQQHIEFLTFCLQPWIVKFEEAIFKRVIPDWEKKDLLVEFLIDGILRGDIKSRYEAYGTGLDRGFLSINDVRRMENMNEIDGGDKYYKALNLAPVAEAQN